MRTMCSREIFTKKCWQQQIFDSDLKGAWHYNHVTFTPIAKNFMLYCRLIYMLSILCVKLTIKVKVGIPESFKVGWYPLKKTGSSHLNFQWKKTLVPESHSFLHFSRAKDVISHLQLHQRNFLWEQWEPEKLNVKFHKNCENTGKILKMSCVRCNFVKFDIPSLELP